MIKLCQGTEGYFARRDDAHEVFVKFDPVNSCIRTGRTYKRAPTTRFTRQIRFEDILEVLVGQHTQLFKESWLKYPRLVEEQYVLRSFSLKLKTRTLDFVTDTAEERNMWVDTINSTLKKLRRTM